MLVNLVCSYTCHWLEMSNNHRQQLSSSEGLYSYSTHYGSYMEGIAMYICLYCSCESGLAFIMNGILIIIIQNPMASSK